MDNNSKSQVIQRLKDAQNILVTVSSNPSIDQLAAALGFTLMMNRLDKNATAVFSGEIPSVLEFLQPEETIETTTDSLRDFIIALDKSKADKLKYKVEDDVVKVFITPYKTTLTEKDLTFSQGDFNVDVVVALGVSEKENIDKAITAHGRILHDATVIGISNSDEPIDVGSINWQDTKASSLCEMLASTSDKFKSGLLDGQIATSFLTGIVSETDRFSNEKTSPKTMTISAQLMAAGANQQLVTTELEPAPTYQTDDDEEVDDSFDELPPPDEEGLYDDDQDSVSPDGTLRLSHKHDDEESGQDQDDQFKKYKEEEVHIDESGNYKSAEDLNAAITDVQVSAEQANNDDKNEKASLPSQNHYSKYIDTKAPENPINSNIGGPQQDIDSFNPLAEIPVAAPIEEMTPSGESPLLSTQHDAESPSAVSVPSTPDEANRLVSDGETSLSKPLGPNVDSHDTLENIEKSVMSFEESGKGAILPTQDKPVSESPNLPDEKKARDAVMDAVESAYNPDIPEPIESLGAVDLPDPQNKVVGDESKNIQPEPISPDIFDQKPPSASQKTEEADKVQGTLPPPPEVPPPFVPPPFVPPLPIYDPNQNQQP